MRQPFLALFILLAACGTSSNAPVPADPSTPAWGVLPDGADRAGIAATATPWPRTPSWVPAYPAALVDVADIGPGNGIISFRSADPPAAVISFYAARCKKAGLVIRSRTSSGPQHELDAGTDQRGLSVNAAALNGGSVVSLAYRAS